jgi:serine/threonine-protein kinase/endoribonuclease IRE1
VWFGIDVLTGARTERLSHSSAESVCPASTASTLFIGRTEYQLAMFDGESRLRRWNATFSDYSAHLLPGERCSFPFPASGLIVA